MGDAAKILANDLLVATGSTCPVQAHRFADAAGFTLRPTSGKSQAHDDVFEYDATATMDEQESSILDMMARWCCRRSGDPETPEDVAGVIDLWLDASACQGDVGASEVSKQA